MREREREENKKLLIIRWFVGFIHAPCTPVIINKQIYNRPLGEHDSIQKDMDMYDVRCTLFGSCTRTHIAYTHRA